MGYTHYWRQHQPATPEQWDAICTDFRRAGGAALNQNDPFPIQFQDDNPVPPFISTEVIEFNGIGEDGHETMILERRGRPFEFCKTAQKPYDRAVIALLLIAYKHAPLVWEISSDGDASDWQPTRDWLNTLGMGSFKLPLKVLGETT